MIWLYGQRWYGKVDHIPGLSFVVTSFLDVYQFIPLVPVRSYLIFDDSVGNRTVLLRSCHLLSIAMAYLRAMLGLCAFAATCAFLLTTLMAFEGTTHPLMPLPFLGAMGSTILLFWLTFRLTCHGIDRARVLLERTGISPDLINHLLDDYESKSHGPRSVAESNLPTQTISPQPGGIDARFSKDTHS